MPRTINGVYIPSVDPLNPQSKIDRKLAIHRAVRVSQGLEPRPIHDELPPAGRKVAMPDAAQPPAPPQPQPAAQPAPMLAPAIPPQPQPAAAGPAAVQPARPMLGPPAPPRPQQGMNEWDLHRMNGIQAVQKALMGPQGKQAQPASDEEWRQFLREAEAVNKQQRKAGWYLGLAEKNRAQSGGAMGDREGAIRSKLNTQPHDPGPPPQEPANGNKIAQHLYRNRMRKWAYDQGRWEASEAVRRAGDSAKAKKLLDLMRDEIQHAGRRASQEDAQADAEQRLRQTLKDREAARRDAGSQKALDRLAVEDRQAERIKAEDRRQEASTKARAARDESNLAAQERMAKGRAESQANLWREKQKSADMQKRSAVERSRASQAYQQAVTHLDNLRKLGITGQEFDEAADAMRQAWRKMQMER